MMSKNIFFYDDNHSYFGERFGYAITYTMTETRAMKEAEPVINVKFGPMVPAEDLSTKSPQPVDLVSECLQKLAIECDKKIIAEVYNTRFPVDKKDELYDIKRTIRKIQMNLIHISNNAEPRVANYLRNGIMSVIKYMPVY